TIRVAVVATGTDATMVQALEPMKASTTRAPLNANTVRRAIEQQTTPQPQPQPVYAQQFEADVRQAVAEAITYQEPAPVAYEHDEGVTVEPYIPNGLPDHLEEPVRAQEQPVPSVYVPSHAERPQGDRRMPRTEE